MCGWGVGLCWQGVHRTVGIAKDRAREEVVGAVVSLGLVWKAVVRLAVEMLVEGCVD